MSVLADEDRQRLLELAGDLADQATNTRDELRRTLFMLGLSIVIADATVTVTSHLEDLAFQRGRAIAMLEHCDTLDKAGENVRRRGEGA